LDVASDVDGWKVGRHRLGDQTRSDADHSSTSRALVDSVVRPSTLPILGEVWHSATAAKAYIQHFHGSASLSAHRYSPV